MSTLEFKPLTFEKVSKTTRIRPWINLSQNGLLWIRGELVSLHQAKNVLVFAMNFYPSEMDFDAGHEGRLNELGGWATFILAKKGSNYFGRIVDGAGIRHGNFDHGEFQRIGSTTPYPGHPGRESATFLLKGWGEYPINEVSVSVYLRTRLFGGWKEVIIEEPEGMVCIARP